MANGPTKAELQETLESVGSSILDMLDPALTREELVSKVKELDELVNGSDEDELFDNDDDDSDEDEDEDDSDEDDDQA